MYHYYSKLRGQSQKIQPTQSLLSLLISPCPISPSVVINTEV